MDTSGRSSGTRGRPLWRNRDFVLLESGLLLSSIGTSLTTIAYPLLTISVTGSAAKAGLVTSARLLPYGGLSLAAGVAGGRWGRSPARRDGSFRHRPAERGRRVLGDLRRRARRGDGVDALHRGGCWRAQSRRPRPAAAGRSGDTRGASVGRAARRTAARRRAL